MSLTVPTTTSRRAALIIRDPGHRILAGVCAAAGQRLGVDAMFVRVAFAVLSLAGGVGVLAYLILWALTPERPGGDPRPGPAPNLHRASALGMQVMGALLLLRAMGLWLGDPLVWPLAMAALGSCVLWALTPERPGGDPRPGPAPNLHRASALGMQVMGALLLLRAMGLWLGDPLVWPLAMAALGSCVLWARSDNTGRARWTAMTAGDRPLGPWLTREASLPRRLLGVALALSGLFALVVANVGLNDLGGALVAFALTVAGLTVLLGPAIWRLVVQVGQERRERIRSEERAEIGAHLHDSVLHTLALIQRSESPQEMATLARSQERELRTWLQGRAGAAAGETVLSALEQLAARIEATQHAAVDLVVVGDAALDNQLEAVVAAVGEAATNAARHSGVDELAVYVEVEPATVTAYVRDEGKGFDPSAVPEDRRGIAHSIRGRVERHGGTVHIDSSTGEGTEVTITLPRRQP